MKIIEELNDLPKLKPIKEIMSVYIDGIHVNLPRRNGFVFALCGSGGSGKTNWLLNAFRTKAYYRSKFDNIFYFIPASSFSSVAKHPFSEHSEIYHDLTTESLDVILDKLMDIKSTCIENDFPQENSLIIIDDFANALKENHLQEALNNMIVKTRHLNCCWIFTLQAYNLFPKILRKQITNASIFKPKNNEEWDSINGELLNLKKDDLRSLYNYCFSEPYSHLDIDTVENKLYKNFNFLKME